jgi:hypothetical protein
LSEQGQQLKRGTVANRYFAMGTIVMAAATLASQAVYAESAAIPTTLGHATFKSPKRVSFKAQRLEDGDQGEGR